MTKQKAKEKKLDELRIIQQSIEERECSFRPATNVAKKDHAKKQLQRIRSQENVTKVADRLHDWGKKQQKN